MFKTDKTIADRFFALLVVMLLGVVLSACSSGSNKDSGPLPDQQARGLYKDGTAQLDGGSVMLNDLWGFVHDDRIMVFSLSGHVLYDGQITSLTSDDFEATVDVYEIGVKTQTDVAVSGKVLTESKITGTINGAGLAMGDFTLTFDPLYHRGASYERIDTNQPNSVVPYYFEGNIMNSTPGSYTDNLSFTDIYYYGMLVLTPDYFACGSGGQYTIPDNNINLYAMSEEISQAEPECTMSETPTYTGFAAVVDSTFEDDTLIYAVSNGINAQFAVLVKP